MAESEFKVNFDHDGNFDKYKFQTMFERSSMHRKLETMQEFKARFGFIDRDYLRKLIPLTYYRVNIDYSFDQAHLCEVKTREEDFDFCCAYGGNYEIVYHKQMSIFALLKLLSNVVGNYTSLPIDPLVKGKIMDIYSYMCLRTLIRKLTYTLVFDSMLIVGEDPIS